jgi:hypothetical protein
VKRSALLGVAVIAGVVAAFPSAAGAATTCKASTAPGAKIVIASKKAVVYRRRQTDPHHDGAQWIHYGCLYSRDRAWQLTRFVEFSQFLGPWALAGRYVAYAYDVEEAAGGEQNDEIHVVDLRTGKQKPGAREATEGSPQGESRAQSIVLKPNASVAWIASYHGESFEDVIFQVFAIETGRGGKKRKLDEGGAIRPNSLALSANGKTLYWRAGSETRSESLR